jgi:hypothetical protein
MKTVPKYSPEVRERAVRMVFEHQPIGNIPPAEVELMYYRQQDESAIAA